MGELSNSSFRIMLVDDMQANVEFMADILKQKPEYQVVATNNGRTAISKAMAQPLDLILLDVVMPDIDGFEVCEKLKSHPKTKGIPIIFLTSKNEQSSIIKGFHVGAVDYILKPFSAEELHARVSVHLNLKRSQESLKAAKEIAEAATAAKSLFLANMSHEIRTPMNGIVGMADILKKTRLTTEQKEYIDIIETSGESLLTIINDILDFSKIESGQIEFESIPFTLSDILDEVVKLLSFKAKQKNLGFNYNIDSAVATHLKGDPVRLKQIIINLSNNAIKFTARGSVSINISQLAESSNEAMLKFEVIDTGIGIEAEAIPRLFQSFSQANLSTSRKFGGTGLGLAISKELSKLMHGEIGVESELGKGSTFWFTARITKQTEEETIQNKVVVHDDSKTPRKLKVLLAEDNVINQRVAVINLKNMGHEVIVTEDGRTCFEAYKNDVFDIVLMDIQMPVLDGIEATSAIRKWEQQENCHRIPIVALTANALSGDREKYLDAGMDSHLTKPFKPDGLNEVFENLIADYYQ